MPEVVFEPIDEVSSRMSLEQIVKSHWTILCAVITIASGTGAFMARVDARQAQNEEHAIRTDVKVDKLGDKVNTIQANQEKYHIESVQHLSYMEGLLRKQVQP